MRIAVLGTGNVGTALGTPLREGGHDVVFGSRDPQEHPGSVSQADAVASVEVIITAIPGLAVLPTLEAVGEEALGDKIVLDPSVAANCLPRRPMPPKSSDTRYTPRHPATATGGSPLTWTGRRPRSGDGCAPPTATIHGGCVNAAPA